MGSISFDFKVKRPCHCWHFEKDKRTLTFVEIFVFIISWAASQFKKCVDICLRACQEASKMPIAVREFEQTR